MTFHSLVRAYPYGYGTIKSSTHATNVRFRQSLPGNYYEGILIPFSNSEVL